MRECSVLCSLYFSRSVGSSPASEQMALEETKRKRQKFGASFSRICGERASGRLRMRIMISI